MRNFSLCSRGCCHCGYHSCEPVLFQSGGQTEHHPSCWFPASFSATLLSAPPVLTPPLASGLGLQSWLWGTSDCQQPLHLALVITAGIWPGCATFSSHAHTGELCSPPEFVCHISSLITTRLDASDHVQTFPVKSLSF